MASHEPSRVPPPHDNPAAAVVVVARPKPLWQPWSDSDDDRDLTNRTGDSSNNSSSTKELPTRTKKERRRHERHHDLLSTAARARKERAQAQVEQQQDDRPLDFSTGRRASPPPYSAVAAGSSSSGLPSYPLRYPSPPDYSSSARPSVITCASSLRSSPAPSCPSPCGSTSSSTSQPRGTTGSPRPAADGQQQRREIISSGMCDPVIDEHFRRSLGERYTHLFASSSPSSTSSTSNTVNDSSSRDKMPSTVNVTGLSVDDHFAKALGETWLKLQSETKEKEETNSPDSQPGSPLPSQRPAGLLLT